MKQITGFFIIFAFLATCPINIARADPKKPAIGIEEHLGSYVPGDIVFKDEDGKDVNVRKLIDKPTLVAFVYFNCPGICSPLQTGIADVINKIKMEPGRDFQVLSISFDHRDTPQLGKKWQKKYLSEIKRPFNTSDWKFLTGDSLSILRLTNALGFYFKPEKEDFIHTATIIAVSPNGEITRYLLGTEFLPFDVKMAIVEASKGKATPTINKLLQFCYRYDPNGKKYVFNVTRVAGGAIFLAIGIFFLVLVIKGKNKKSDEGVKI